MAPRLRAAPRHGGAGRFWGALIEQFLTQRRDGRIDRRISEEELTLLFSCSFVTQRGSIGEDVRLRLHPSDSLRSREGVESQLSDTVGLLMPGTQLTVWSCDDGTPFPSFNEEIDPDDLSPEGTITKQFWKSKYASINQWLAEK